MPIALDLLAWYLGDDAVAGTPDDGEELLVHRAAVADRTRCEALLAAWSRARARASAAAEAVREQRYPDGWFAPPDPVVPSCPQLLEPEHAQWSLSVLGYFVRKAPPPPTLDEIQDHGASELRAFWHAHAPPLLRDAIKTTCEVSREDVRSIADILARHAPAESSSEQLDPELREEDAQRAAQHAGAIDTLQRLLAKNERSLVVSAPIWNEVQGAMKGRVAYLIEVQAPAIIIASELGRPESMAPHLLCHESPATFLEMQQAAIDRTHHALSAACLGACFVPKREELGVGAVRRARSLYKLDPPSHQEIGSRTARILLDRDIEEHADRVDELRAEIECEQTAMRMAAFAARCRELAAQGSALIVDVVWKGRDE
jgi:hypothetical protein